MKTEAFLPDINVWLALTFEAHRRHPTSRTWFESVGDSRCAFCRLTQMGFLRLANSPAVFADEALSLAEAWSCYDQLRDDPRVGYAPEPVGLDRLWRAYTVGRSRSPGVWNDAYLAAFGEAAGITVVSFDRGFRRFRNLDCLILQ